MLRSSLPSVRVANTLTPLYNGGGLVLGTTVACLGFLGGGWPRPGSGALTCYWNRGGVKINLSTTSGQKVPIVLVSFEQICA